MGVIGENIKAARVRLGITQTQLAQMAGITKAAISRYEAGLREPKIEHLRSIADALEVSIGYLEGYEAIDSKKIYDAIVSKDAALVENLMGLDAGSVKFLPPEEEQALMLRFSEEREEKARMLERIKIILKFRFKTLSESDVNDIDNLIQYFAKLNPEGRIKAIERVGELTEIPKYQKSITNE